MANAIDLVNNIVQIGKNLRDVAERIKDAQTKNLIADLNLSLADLKMQVAEFQEENLELRKKVKTLESAAEVRTKLELRNSAYWFVEDPPAGWPAGPYCTGCFDVNEKLVVLGPHPVSLSGYMCPGCKHVFDL